MNNYQNGIHESVTFRVIYRLSTATALGVFFVRYIKQPTVTLFVVAIAIFAFALGCSFGGFRMTRR